MALLRKQPAKVEALAVAREMDQFDLLIEDLDGEYTGTWQGCGLDDAVARIAALDLELAECVILAVQRQDEADLDPFEIVISTAKARGLNVLLVVEELTPTAIHQLVRRGADEFTPYPLPEGVLSESLAKMRSAPVQAAATMGTARRGMILPVHGIAGGVGASTMAINLAWEMAQAPRKVDRKVCIIDLNLQFGSIATYLDLARRDATMQLLADPQGRDKAAVLDAMTTYGKKLSVLTAPPDTVPFDIADNDDIRFILDVAASSYDFVIVDMPSVLVNWTSVVLEMAETYFAVMELDMRCAQNMLRFLRALKSEDLPLEKVQYVMNRTASGFGGNKARIKRMAESLGIEYNVMLPDGGKAVVAAADQGAPLAETASGNVLRKEVRKIAKSLVDLAEKQKLGAI
ncbi:pilus assembly protein CpaE [Monaibacterium marinum]|uniref:Pilus assembly protein CpaE n=2 Tax=Pontivivens marinum TaxID=1690039 RepID=A0A2C9CTX2_9RHOB|nr:pilus assembly protein CpaE [Monaibacterium marinum]